MQKTVETLRSFTYLRKFLTTNVLFYLKRNAVYKSASFLVTTVFCRSNKQDILIIYQTSTRSRGDRN